MKNGIKHLLSVGFFLVLAAAGGIPARGSDVVLFTSLRTPSDSLFKEIYGNSVIDSGLNVGITLFRALELRVDASVFYRKGKSTVLEEPTTIALVSPGMGLRYAPEMIAGIRPYLGGGACFGYYWEDFHLGDSEGWAAGYKLEGGVRVRLFKKIWVDLNVSDIVLKAKADGETINLGGLRFAFGVCQAF